MQRWEEYPTRRFNHYQYAYWKRVVEPFNYYPQNPQFVNWLRLKNLMDRY